MDSAADPLPPAMPGTKRPAHAAPTDPVPPVGRVRLRKAVAVVLDAAGRRAELSSHPLAAVLSRTPSLLTLLSTLDAKALRGADKALRSITSEHPWDDVCTPVTDVRRWRACFPHAHGMRYAKRATARVPSKAIVTQELAGHLGRLVGLKSLVFGKGSILCSTFPVNWSPLADLEVLEYVPAEYEFVYSTFHYSVTAILAAVRDGALPRLRSLRLAFADLSPDGAPAGSHVPEAPVVVSPQAQGASTLPTPPLGFGRLRELCLTDLEGPASIISAIFSCSELKSLKLCAPYSTDPVAADVQVTDDLLRGLPLLEDLALRERRFCWAATTSGLLKNNAKLRSLSLDLLAMSNDANVSLPATLTSLTLINTLFACIPCPELVSFKCIYTRSNYHVPDISAAAKLESLFVRSWRGISDAALMHHNHLAKLDVGFTENSPEDPFTETTLGRLPLLRHLCLDRGTLTLLTPATFCFTPLLEFLHLPEHSEITFLGGLGEIFRPLRALRILHVEGLAGFHVRDVIPSLPALTDLHLDLPACSSRSASTETLSLNWLRGSNVKRLVISGRTDLSRRPSMGFADATIAQAADLEVLSLQYCDVSRVSDAGWAALRDLRELHITQSRGLPRLSKAVRETFEGGIGPRLFYRYI